MRDITVVSDERISATRQAVISDLESLREKHDDIDIIIKMHESTLEAEEMVRPSTNFGVLVRKLLHIPGVLAIVKKESHIKREGLPPIPGIEEPPATFATRDIPSPYKVGCEEPVNIIYVEDLDKKINVSRCAPGQKFEISGFAFDLDASPIPRVPIVCEQIFEGRLRWGRWSNSSALSAILSRWREIMPGYPLLNAADLVADIDDNYAIIKFDESDSFEAHVSITLRAFNWIAGILGGAPTFPMSQLVEAAVNIAWPESDFKVDDLPSPVPKPTSALTSVPVPALAPASAPIPKKGKRGKTGGVDTSVIDGGIFEGLVHWIAATLRLKEPLFVNAYPQETLGKIKQLGVEMFQEASLHRLNRYCYAGLFNNMVLMSLYDQWIRWQYDGIEPKFEKRWQMIKQKVESQVEARGLYPSIIRERQLRNIYSRKYGLKKYFDAYPKQGSYAAPFPPTGKKFRNEPIETLIDPSEYEVISAEYKRLEMERTSRAENPCPHVGVVDELNSASTDVERRRALKLIEQYLPKVEKVKPRWLDCAVCKKVLACSHIIELTKLQVTNAPISALNNLIDQYAVRPSQKRSKAERDVEDEDDMSLYCAICGQYLKNIDPMNGNSMTESGLSVASRRPEEESTERIWNISIIVVRQNFSFFDSIDARSVNNFVKDIAAKLHPFIDQIEIKISKVKTLSDLERSQQLQFYTIVYTFAIMANLVVDNPMRVTVKSKKKFKPVQKINPDTVYTECVHSLLSQNRSLLAQIKMGDKSAESCFYKARENLTLKLGKAHMSDVRVSNLTESLTYSSLYKYWWYMTCLEKKKTIKFDDVDSILGLSIEEIKKSGAIFRDARTPILPGFDPKKNKFLELGEGKVPDASLEDIERDYKQTCFMLTVSSVKGGHHNLTTQPRKMSDSAPVAGVFSRRDARVSFGKEDEDEEDTGSVQPPEREEHEIRVKEVLRVEEMWLAVRRIRAFIPRPSIKLGPNWDRKIKFIDVPLSLTYGIKGDKVHNHQWVPFFKNISADKAPLFTDIAEKRRIEAEGGYVICADYKCKICDQVRSKPPKEDLSDAIYDNRLRSDFYNFYTILCPSPPRVVKENKYELNEVHVWSGSVCKNCGLTQKALNDRERDYYVKWRSMFFRATEKPMNIEESKTPVAPDKKKTLKTIPELTKAPLSWERALDEFVVTTYDVLVKNSGTRTLTRKEYTYFIKNIGLLESMELIQIVSGAYDPSDKTQYIGQCLMMRYEDYMRLILIYSKIYDNRKNIVNLHPTVENIAKEIDSENLSSGLVDKIEKFIDEVNKTIRGDATDEQRARYMFIKLLELLTLLVTETKRYGLWFVSHIIDLEKLTTSPEGAPERKIVVKAHKDTHLESDTDFDEITDPLELESLDYNNLDYEIPEDSLSYDS